MGDVSLGAISSILLGWVGIVVAALIVGGVEDGLRGGLYPGNEPDSSR